MKKLSLIFILLITSTTLSSCKKSADKKEIKVITNTFAKAMQKPVNFKVMSQLYHNFPFMSVVRVDEYKIKSIEEKDGNYITDITTSLINSNEDKFTNNFLLKFGKIDDSWKIIDSKGLSNLKSFYSKEYDFALKTNLLKNESELWGVELKSILMDAKKQIKEIKKGLKEMAELSAKANESVRKSDIAAAKAHKAFEEFEAKNKKN